MITWAICWMFLNVTKLESIEFTISGIFFLLAMLADIACFWAVAYAIKWRTK